MQHTNFSCIGSLFCKAITVYNSKYFWGENATLARKLTKVLHMLKLLNQTKIFRANPRKNPCAIAINFVNPAVFCFLRNKRFVVGLTCLSDLRKENTCVSK